IHAIAREDDADGAIALVGGEAFKELVDGEIHAISAAAWFELENAFGNFKGAGWWNHIDVIRLDHGLVGDFHDGHFGGAGKEFGEFAFVGRVEVLNKDESHAGLGGNFFQKLRKGFVAAGGGANADNQERFGLFFGGFDLFFGVVHVGFGRF